MLIIVYETINSQNLRMLKHILMQHHSYEILDHMVIISRQNIQNMFYSFETIRSRNSLSILRYYKKNHRNKLLTQSLSSFFFYKKIILSSGLYISKRRERKQPHDNITGQKDHASHLKQYRILIADVPNILLNFFFFRITKTTMAIEFAI